MPNPLREPGFDGNFSDFSAEYEIMDPFGDGDKQATVIVLGPTGSVTNDDGKFGGFWSSNHNTSGSAPGAGVPGYAGPTQPMPTSIALELIRTSPDDSSKTENYLARLNQGSINNLNTGSNFAPSYPPPTISVIDKNKPNAPISQRVGPMAQLIRVS